MFRKTRIMIAIEKHISDSDQNTKWKQLKNYAERKEREERGISYFSPPRALNYQAGGKGVAISLSKQITPFRTNSEIRKW